MLTNAVQHCAIQLFKLGGSSMCGCSHHEDAWLYREGHERLRPRPHSNPRHVVSLKGSLHEHLYVWKFFQESRAQTIPWRDLPTGMLAIRDSLTAPLPPWCRRHQSGGRSAGGSPHAAPLRQWAASRVGKQTCLRVLVSRLACGNRARLAQASVRVAPSAGARRPSRVLQNAGRLGRVK